MAYQLRDGFDDYNASTERWSAVNGTMSYSSSYARFAAPSGLLGQGLKMATGGSQWKKWNMVSNQAAMIFGFAVFLPQLGSGGPLLQFYDASSAQCGLGVTAAGALYLQQGSLGSVIAISAPG